MDVFMPVQLRASVSAIASASIVLLKTRKTRVVRQRVDARSCNYWEWLVFDHLLSANRLFMTLIVNRTHISVRL